MIDTHCHVFKEYYNNIDEVINKMENNIIIISGTNDQDNKEVLELCKKYPNVYGTIGIHPTEEYSSNSLKFVEDFYDSYCILQKHFFGYTIVHFVEILHTS